MIRVCARWTRIARLRCITSQGCLVTGDHEIRSSLFEMRVPPTSVVRSTGEHEAGSTLLKCVSAGFGCRSTGDHEVRSTLSEMGVRRPALSLHRRSGDQEAGPRNACTRSSVAVLQEITRSGAPSLKCVSGGLRCRLTGDQETRRTGFETPARGLRVSFYRRSRGQEHPL